MASLPEKLAAQGLAYVAIPNDCNCGWHPICGGVVLLLLLLM